ncbi:Alpha/beta knot methyltransferase [Gilbertella persicaria]|uniref:Alpha/beta knot methyltransferase n=1 Tax=Gilbertella persicaria TaxID=101096 RepID=UPI00221FED92|nr:Alpha/beta knot methyltransferase [Gilbertella persicaria]KAI8063375.1 Alpha/beta knot methyltransferase [Gilbertella persicaria]
MFKKITSQQNAVVKHWIALREKKQYRLDQQRVVVQGAKIIKELYQQGCQIRSLAITTDKKDKDIKHAALDMVQHPLPADAYYETDIHLARRILGTSSRPGKHDVFAEIPVPSHTPSLKDTRLLVFDKINDPGNLGTLVRSARALGWQSGLISEGTCDLYNDKVVRASKGLSILWPHTSYKHMQTMLTELKQHHYTPLVADMLPATLPTDLWSPENAHPIKPGAGLCLWNFPQTMKRQVPQKIALILSSEHQGVHPILDQEIKVSLPMYSHVESLNVANAGSIIMFELNKWL